MCLSLQSRIPRMSDSVSTAHKHKCSQCHRSYTSAHGLRVHEDMHSGRYPYWCQICGKGFPATSNLRGHMATHTGVAEFKCDVCGRQYRYQCDYKRHMKQHSVWTDWARWMLFGELTLRDWLNNKHLNGRIHCVRHCDIYGLDGRITDLLIGSFRCVCHFFRWLCLTVGTRSARQRWLLWDCGDIACVS